MREFRTFVAVYEERSFTGAAFRMNATQSGISQQVKKIEQVVGIRLFDRGTRTVKPTAQGELYYLHCQRLLREYDEAVSDLKEQPGTESGTSISLGVVPWLSRCILPPVLARFAAAYPGITLNVEEASGEVLEARLREGHLNLIVSENDVCDSDTINQGAVSQCVLVTGRHERGVSRDILPAELATRNIILPPKGNPLRTVADRMFAGYGVKPAKSIEINSISAAVNLAAQSSWSAFVPIVALVAETATIDCVVDRIVGGPDVGVVVRTRRISLTPTEQILRENLMAELTRFALNTQLISQSYSGRQEPKAVGHHPQPDRDRWAGAMAERYFELP
ncbi:LysR family transcriptional regulator [Hoeflea alexandrii]|uniref:LysR family transcriptional regulator n=1 Tax=Hoeflea alexandrii TaxID=288436 RepID=UPI0022AE692E|nr:LysR family transcriptional regulator [Hoeflea alexandrii]MCZ4291981.1 LysR family transcriptional regulator [Hoeflea alexandrii]